jgi:hypothetical protein
MALCVDIGMSAFSPLVGAKQTSVSDWRTVAIYEQDLSSPLHHHTITNFTWPPRTSRPEQGNDSAHRASLSIALGTDQGQNGHSKKLAPSKALGGY